MLCPKCRFEHQSDATECPRCGVIFAKYVPRPKALTPVAPPTRPEFRYRLFALPAALLGARLLVGVAPSAVRMFSMWIHELGHAATAWLCGFSAIPGPWFTPVDSERSLAVTVVLAGLLIFGGVRAWGNRRVTLSIALGATLLAQLIFTFKLYSDQAQQFIIFGGDAGCFVLGGVLMATFYIRRQSIIYENSLRWAFLVIGALAFMDAFAVWTGGIEKIPFGENENGLSDPSVLTELYGWKVNLLRTRYQRLAMLCLAARTTLYACGLAIVAREGKMPQRDPGLDYS